MDGFVGVHAELARQIIGTAMQVHSVLGCGFLEKVYERAMAIELQDRGIASRCQVSMTVYYRGQNVGDYIADMLVEEIVLLELKATEKDHPAFHAQTINVVTAAQLPVALLLNFGQTRLHYRRFEPRKPGTRNRRTEELNAYDLENWGTSGEPQ